MAQEVTKLTINEKGGVEFATDKLDALGDEEVRIQVLCTGISKNDLLLLEGKSKNDFFGPEAIGKVVETGKNVGHCKVGQIVGVHHPNTNSGDLKSGFASHLQVHQDRVVYIPDSIPAEQAACLIGTGTIAFNAVEKIEPGSTIAVVGTGHLAYLTTQFAKKVFKLTVTIFGYEGNEELQKSFGADAFVILSKESLQKYG
jgi:D-arabinose 1-dehydrogenase-like Zn-dependent alcohol dehydrogenase